MPKSICLITSIAAFSTLVDIFLSPEALSPAIVLLIALVIDSSRLLGNLISPSVNFESIPNAAAPIRAAPVFCSSLYAIGLRKTLIACKFTDPAPAFPPRESLDSFALLLSCCNSNVDLFIA